MFQLKLSVVVPLFVSIFFCLVSPSVSRQHIPVWADASHGHKILQTQLWQWGLEFVHVCLHSTLWKSWRSKERGWKSRESHQKEWSNYKRLNSCSSQLFRSDITPTGWQTGTQRAGSQRKRIKECIFLSVLGWLKNLRYFPIHGQTQTPHTLCKMRIRRFLSFCSASVWLWAKF